MLLAGAAIGSLIRSECAPRVRTVQRLCLPVIRFGILRASVKFLWYVTGKTMFFSFPFARFLIKKEESIIRLLLSEGWPIPCNGGAGIT